MYSQDILIELIKNDPDRALPILYDQFSGSLLGVINRIVKNEADANDLLQEVFLKIWQARHQYDPDKGRLFTWMMQIARNTSINFIQSKPQKVKEKIHPIDSSVYHIKSRNKLNIETLDVVDMLQKLDERYREVIELAYFEGYTQREISDRLNLPLGSVKSFVKIGLRNLRAIYEGSDSIQRGLISFIGCFLII